MPEADQDPSTREDSRAVHDDDSHQQRNQNQDAHAGERDGNGGDGDGRGKKDAKPRSKKPLIILAVVIVLLAVVAFVWWFMTRNRISTDDAYTDGNAVAIAPKVAGYVVKLAVNDNVYVHKGDLLVEIDPREYRAQVDDARAQFYPDITLTGQIGTRASNASDLARWSHLFYSFGPAISLPIFEGGQLVANLHLANARQAEAALAYRKAVLVALRDVDNALAVYRTDLSHRDALSTAVDTQRSAFDLAREPYAKGFVSFVDVLDAQRQLSQVQAQFVQAQTQVETDLVALYKALGGGWQDAA